MTYLDILKANYRQPKYMLPAIIYVPLLFLGYFICNFFNIEKAEVNDSNLETVEHLNDHIPEAHIKGDGLGDKYDNMLDAYGKIKDASAVENVEKQEEQKEGYESKYSDAELAALEQQSDEQARAVEQIRRMQEEMKASQNKGMNASLDRSGGNTSQEDATLHELQSALAQARQQANGNVAGAGASSGDSSDLPPQIDVKAHGKIAAPEKPQKEKVVKEIEEDAKPEEVVVKTKEISDYFNTIDSNGKDRKLIKAIIDEDIKAVDGSRVRLRLLEDIEVGETTIPKGTYLYATMSDFSSQRVKGTVRSVFMNDELIKINLSIYDTDGLEGLYVPESSFRTTAKDVGSQTLNTTPSFNTGTTVESSFVQWGMNAVQQGVQKTSQAFSKNIKKNRVKLKYGTFVYLINSKERKKKQEGSNFDPSKAGGGQNMQQQFQNIINQYK